MHIKLYWEETPYSKLNHPSDLKEALDLPNNAIKQKDLLF